ncbi:MAG: hypothetical protein HYU66_19760 [Armatimonadetes bacterium]|nr:hypothetical protein [Armatimonadota bacterium]
MMLGRASITRAWLTHQTEIPSGVALQMAMTPYLKKLESYQEVWSTAFERLFDLWLAMAGEGPAQVLTVWAQVLLLDPLQALQAAQLADDLGMPLSQTAEFLGRTPEQVAEWAAARGAMEEARVAAVTAQTG